MAKKIYTWLYYLLDLVITKEQGDFTAKVRKVRPTRTIEDIAQQMVKEGTELKVETIVDVLKRANRIKIEFLSLGDSVNDGTAIYDPAIAGVFYGSAYDETQHSCTVNVHTTSEVNQMAAQAKGEYSGLTVDNGGAAIEKITDSATGADNGEVTPGDNITITGNKIRVVPEEGETPASCITYTNVATEQVIEQEKAPVINDPSKIVLLLPELPVGEHTLTIKTLFSSGSILLKAPRYIIAKTKLLVK